MSGYFLSRSIVRRNIKGLFWTSSFTSGKMSQIYFWKSLATFPISVVSSKNDECRFNFLSPSLFSSSGIIQDIGRDSVIDSRYNTVSFDETVDLECKRSIVPGLIDGHTHPVWDGDRVHEFAMKVRTHWRVVKSQQSFWLRQAFYKKFL